LKENLSVKSVPDEVKYRMLDEIARDKSLQEEVLAIEYYPDWQQVQVNFLYFIEGINEFIIIILSSTKTKLC